MNSLPRAGGGIAGSACGCAAGLLMCPCEGGTYGRMSAQPAAASANAIPDANRRGMALLVTTPAPSPGIPPVGRIPRHPLAPSPRAAASGGLMLPDLRAYPPHGA